MPPSKPTPGRPPAMPSPRCRAAPVAAAITQSGPAVQTALRARLNGERRNGPILPGLGLFRPHMGQATAAYAGAGGRCGSLGAVFLGLRAY